MYCTYRFIKPKGNIVGDTELYRIISVQAIEGERRTVYGGKDNEPEVLHRGLHCNTDIVHKGRGKKQVHI